MALDPIPLDARVSCSAPDSNGVRSALVTASAPWWATVRFDRVEQAPELCGSAESSARRRSTRGLHFTPLVLGAGRSLDARGLGPWTVFLGAGISVGG